MTAAQPVLDILRRRGASLATLPARFDAKVDRTGDCWIWTGHRNEHGYGQIDRVRAHRVAYFLATGTDPDDLGVLHHCDNPPCVRPTHLFLGTPADNTADKVAKGRATGPKTVRDEDIDPIRLLWAEGALTQVEIGARYGISGQQVGRIVRGRSRADGRVESPWQARGFRRAQTVLTDADVADIRRRYVAGGVTQRALAAEYGVGQPHISYIVRGVERTTA